MSDTQNTQDSGSRVAIVAGAGRGVGAAVAARLARDGARVALLARTASAVEERAAAIRATGGDALAIACDVTDDAALAAAVARACDRWAPPTVAVHCAAGMFVPAKLHTLDVAAIDAALALDLRSAVVLARLVAPHMMRARFGRIVLVGSQASQVSQAGGALYATAKAGLEGLARGLALDYGRYGVTANVARLGFVDGPRLRQRTAAGSELRERLERNTAARRIPDSDQIADAIAYLCSEAAWTINGTAVDIDAGAHLNHLW